eukprot:GHVT01088045.1.p1 GENE.GHVT01088045.1~~GHVT01088045.1.p1  ORF type:complete len:202 (-),score=54.33 GHVT01088045.1:286-891(-)
MKPAASAGARSQGPPDREHLGETEALVSSDEAAPAVSLGGLTRHDDGSPDNFSLSTCGSSVPGEGAAAVDPLTPFFGAKEEGHLCAVRVANDDDALAGAGPRRGGSCRRVVWGALVVKVVAALLLLAALAVSFVHMKQLAHVLHELLRWVRSMGSASALVYPLLFTVLCTLGVPAEVMVSRSATEGTTPHRAKPLATSSSW